MTGNTELIRLARAQVAYMVYLNPGDAVQPGSSIDFTVKLAAALETTESERDAALAVIADVRAQVDACRALVAENLVTPDAAASLGLVIRGLDPILAKAAS